MRTLVLILALGALAAGTPRAATAQQAQAPDPELIARGAQIYGSNCARCHNLRSPAEYNDINWRTIIAQMRARANLTREQARAVLSFVQATNGVPSATAAASEVGMAAPPAPATKPQTTGKTLTPAQKRQLAAYLAKLSSRPR